MNERSIKKEVIIAVSSIILLVLFVFIYTRFSFREKADPDSIQNSIVALPQGEISNHFPEGIILDSEASIISSYTSMTAEGAESVLAFHTKKNIYNLIPRYRDFFMRLGWFLEDSRLRGLPPDTIAFNLENKRLVLRYSEDSSGNISTTTEAWVVFITLIESQ